MPERMEVTGHEKPGSQKRRLHLVRSFALSKEIRERIGCGKKVGH